MADTDRDHDDSFERGRDCMENVVRTILTNLDRGQPDFRLGCVWFLLFASGMREDNFVSFTKFVRDTIEGLGEAELDHAETLVGIVDNELDRRKVTAHQVATNKKDERTSGNESI